MHKTHYFLPLRIIVNFIRLESASGLLLCMAAVLAIIICNTPWHLYYQGGMLMPAIIYLVFNVNHANLIQGWAIPTATDIAFALAIIALLGPRISLSLKLFLLALAIFDDIGAIIIIAIFYTDTISILPLLGVGLCVCALLTLNVINVNKVWPYLLIGFFLWLFMLKSGVHATLAGVILAMTIPVNDSTEDNLSVLHRLEHALHPWVAYVVLPLFGFANAGVDLTTILTGNLILPLVIGIAAGLFFGKQLGVLAASWLAVKCKWANLPTNCNWLSLYGVSLICGVGFTMSLFIGSLAFNAIDTAYQASVRVGVLSGSIMSGLLGYLILLRQKKSDKP